MPASRRISYSVAAQRVHHHFKELVRLDQFVDKAPEVLNVDVVVVRTVHEEEFSMKIFRILQQRVLLIAFQIFFLGPH